MRSGTYLLQAVDEMYILHISMMRGIKCVMVAGLVLLFFNNGIGYAQAQSNGQTNQGDATVESRYSGVYDAQIANQDSWIEGLSIIQARDYGVDLFLSGTVVSVVGSLAALSISGAFDSGIANYAPNSVSASPLAFIGLGSMAAIGLLGISMIVVGIADITMADEILAGDGR